MRKALSPIPFFVLSLLLGLGCGKPDEPTGQATKPPTINPRPANASPAPSPTQTAKHIPADVLLVASLNLDALMAKLEVAQLFKQPPFASAGDDPYTKLLMGFAVDPASWGLTLDTPLHVFIKHEPGGENKPPQPMLGLIAAVDDAHKLSAALKNLAQAAGESLDWQDSEGFKYFAGKGDWITGFNNTTWITYGALTSNFSEANPTAEADMKALFAAKDSLTQHPSFTRHLAAPQDVGLWFDERKSLDALQQATQGEITELDRIITKQLDLKASISTALRFATGVVEADVAYSFDAQPFGGSAMKGPGLTKNPGLLNAVDQDALLAFGSSFDMTPMRAWLKKSLEPLVISIGGLRELDNEIQALTGLTLAEAVDLPQGNGVLAWNGMESEPHPVVELPLPRFLLGFSLHDQGKAGKLLEHLETRESLDTFNTFGFDLYQQDRNLFFSAASMKAQHAIKPVQGARRELLAGHNLGGWIDFPAILKLAAQLGAPKEVTTPFAQLGLLTMTGDFAPGLQTFKIKLELKDTGRNSVRLIVEELLKLSATLGGSD